MSLRNQKTGRSYRRKKTKEMTKIKLKEVLDKADYIRPNAVPDIYKLNAVNKLETMVQTEIYRIPLPEQRTYTLSETDAVLLIPAPYDTLYEKYLAAEIDLEQSEFEAYQNDYVLFNEEYKEFSAYVMRAKGHRGAKLKNYW